MPTINAKGYRSISASFTRPADTNVYAAGDLVANSTTAGSVVPMSFGVATKGGAVPFIVPRIRLLKSNNSVTNAQFRIHLFNAAPTFTSSGDNGVFATVVATGAASWIGSYDGTMVARTADGAAVDCLPTAAMLRLDYQSVSGSFYAIIEALAAYTPASAEVFTATLFQEFWL